MDVREADARRYASLGLRANPFDVSANESGDTMGVKLSIRAAALRFLAALDDMGESEEKRPIVIEKGALPAYYHIAALAQTLRALALGDPVDGVGAVYVPVDMMRIGRVRAVLQMAGEHIATVHPEQTLASWTAQVLNEPDVALPEWAPLEARAEELSALKDQLAHDPVEVAERVFGAPVKSRPGAEDIESIMRISMARVDRLDADPEEDADASAATEDATDDPMAEAFISSLGEESEEEAEPEQAEGLEELVAAYVVAYTRANLSPVIARGILAYQAQGISSMAEELKVSKAPTKTLAALGRFACAHSRAETVIFDRFEMWPNVPDDLRIKIVTTLTSLRWALKDTIGLVLMMQPGMAPEVEEAFGTACKVSWDFGELGSIEHAEATVDAAAMRRWFESSSLDGQVPAWADALIDAVPASAPLSVVARAMADAIERAADGDAPPEAEEILLALTPETVD